MMDEQPQKQALNSQNCLRCGSYSWVGISAGHDKGNHLLVATGTSGVTKCPGVPMQPFPLPLTWKGETGNASSKRGFKVLRCSKVRQCWPRSVARSLCTWGFPPCHQGKQSMLSSRTEWMENHNWHQHIQQTQVGYLGKSEMSVCRVTTSKSVKSRC